MTEAGLDPKKTVRTMDDLNKFLGDLKTYVDAHPNLNYVLDTGWHPWIYGTVFPSAMAMGLGHGKEEQRQLFLGKIKWDDMEKNPFVPYFQLYKDWYDKGYIPKTWWTRNWDEYENGNIAQKSLLTFHGPWQWDKIQAGNPAAGAQLDGFPWPADKEGNLYATPTATFAFNTNAAATYTANKSKPNAPDALKAMLWWYSPESVKLQAEAIGSNLPATDLSSVGGADIRHTQYQKVIKPVLDGEFGKLKYDASLHGADVAARYFKDGSENVMESDAQASLLGDYLEGKTKLEDLMKTFQKRWEAAYNVTA
jgi:ABC-type glycerol-3-phosphate transport system substrate-binding protein